MSLVPNMISYECHTFSPFCLFLPRRSIPIDQGWPGYMFTQKKYKSGNMFTQKKILDICSTRKNTNQSPLIKVGLDIRSPTKNTNDYTNYKETRSSGEVTNLVPRAEYSALPFKASFESHVKITSASK